MNNLVGVSVAIIDINGLVALRKDDVDTRRGEF